jgi:hypothetical protein
LLAAPAQIPASGTIDWAPTVEKLERTLETAVAALKQMVGVFLLVPLRPFNDGTP